MPETPTLTAISTSPQPEQITLLVVPGTATAAAVFGPLAPPNPFMAPQGLASLHNDAESSDAGPLPGPGAHLNAIFG